MSQKLVRQRVTKVTLEEKRLVKKRKSMYLLLVAGVIKFQSNRRSNLIAHVHKERKEVGDLLSPSKWSAKFWQVRQLLEYEMGRRISDAPLSFVRSFWNDHPAC